MAILVAAVGWSESWGACDDDEEVEGKDDEEEVEGKDDEEEVDGDSRRTLGSDVFVDVEALSEKKWQLACFREKLL